MFASAWVDRTLSPARVIYGDQENFFESDAHIGDAGGPHRLIPIPKDCWWLLRGDDIAVKPRTA